MDKFGVHIVASNNKSVQAEAYKLVYWQMAVVVGVALVISLFRDKLSGLSFLAGGMAYCLPNYIFVRRVFNRTTARAAKEFLVAFLLGEVMKLTLSAILFVLIVKYLPVVFPAVLGGYITAIFAFWVVSFVFLSKDQGEVK
jgi:ATP synthase protein I